jgi:soluble lytic murein transglycosylase-like protein
MQLMPAVWHDEGVRDPFEPRANLRAGARPLRRLIDRFGDLSLGLAAYNAGAATVERYGGVPPFRETRGYLRAVLGRFCPPPADAAPVP